MSSSSSSGLELDPLLKDLTEKKFSFRNNVKALMAELNDVRSRLASQQESLYREIKSRQAAETKARSLDEEIGKLQKFLGERDGQLKASTSLTDLHLRELDDLRSQLSFIQTTAEASTAVAHSAQSQCLSLLKELDEKNNSLKDHESKVNKLGEQLDHLQKDLQARELSQKQLKDEVMRVEKEILHAVTVAGANKDCELRKMLDEISPKNIENINKRLNAKDEEIARLRDEIRYLSTHWKLKTEELESQLEKHKRADQELKKRVLKLEFCLQEAKAHMRKLQRMGERRDKALKELRDQVGMKKHNGAGRGDEPSFWESSGFKLVVTMSMLVLVAIVKRQHWQQFVILPTENTVIWICSLHYKPNNHIKRTLERVMQKYNNEIRDVQDMKLVWKGIHGPRQNNKWVCGFYVMKVMLEIVTRRITDSWDSLFRDRGTAPYTNRDIVEIREMWAKFFITKMEERQENPESSRRRRRSKNKT